MEPLENSFKYNDNKFDNLLKIVANQIMIFLKNKNVYSLVININENYFKDPELYSEFIFDLVH